MTEPDTPKRGRGRPRREGTDAAVRSATIDLLQRQSYTSITLESVAVAAGVAKTTLYRRWPSKAALVIDALRHSLPPAGELGGGAFAGRVLSLARRVHALLTLHGATLSALVVEARGERELLREVRRLLVPDEWRAALEQSTPDRAMVDDTIDFVLGVLWFRLAVLGDDIDDPSLERIVARVAR